MVSHASSLTGASLTGASTPQRTHRSHFRTVGLPAAVATVLLLAACGSDSDNGEEESGNGRGGPSAEDGAFPVTIDHALGSAEITEQPERVVTLGQGSTETAISLGHTPVGMESYAWGSDDTGYLPWVHEAVTEAGDELPEQFTGGEELDIEAILELEPDVILAPWSGVTEDQYDLLSDIAPTVAYPELAWSTDWDEQIEMIATALGHPDEAEVLIDDIEDQLDEAAASRPEYDGVTFSYIYTDGPGTLGVFLPDEQRVEMVSALGLEVDPVVETFDEVEGTESALIGLENAEQLSDSDLIFTFHQDAETQREIEAQPLYAAIPAVANDAVVTSDDQAFVTASSLINPLTVPWAVDRYLPMIDEAVAGLDG